MARELPERRVASLLGVPEKSRSGKDRLVAAAIELFYFHGFQAVGIDRILEQAGVSKSTFYKHFAGKDELMVAAVRRRDEWEMQAWDSAVRELVGEDPCAQLLGYFEVMDRWFTAPEFRGCMFLNTAAEFPNPNDPVHRAAAEHKRRNRNAFRDLAAAAGASDPESFADQYTALLEGTLVLRQVHGRDDAVAVVRPTLEALMTRHGLARPQAERG